MTISKKVSGNINAKKCLIIVCGVWNIRQKWLSVSWPFIVSREIWKALNQIYFVSLKIAQKVLFCCWICTVGDRAVIKVLSKVRYWANWDRIWNMTFCLKVFRFLQSFCFYHGMVTMVRIRTCIDREMDSGIWINYNGLCSRLLLFDNK